MDIVASKEPAHAINPQICACFSCDLKAIMYLLRVEHDVIKEVCTTMSSIYYKRRLS